MTGATVLLGRNALVSIEQMLRPARSSINCPGVRTPNIPAYPLTGRNAACSVGGNGLPDCSHSPPAAQGRSRRVGDNQSLVLASRLAFETALR